MKQNLIRLSGHYKSLLNVNNFNYLTYVYLCLESRLPSNLINNLIKQLNQFEQNHEGL